MRIISKLVYHSNVKNQKEIKSMKIELIKTLNSTDGAYYGLSLENLVLN